MIINEEFGSITSIMSERQRELSRRDLLRITGMAIGAHSIHRIAKGGVTIGDQEPERKIVLLDNTEIHLLRQFNGPTYIHGAGNSKEKTKKAAQIGAHVELDAAYVPFYDTIFAHHGIVIPIFGYLNSKPFTVKTKIPDWTVEKAVEYAEELGVNVLIDVKRGFGVKKGELHIRALKKLLEVTRNRSIDINFSSDNMVKLDALRSEAGTDDGFFYVPQDDNEWDRIINQTKQKEENRKGVWTNAYSARTRMPRLQDLGMKVLAGSIYNTEVAEELCKYKIDGFVSDFKTLPVVMPHMSDL